MICAWITRKVDVRLGSAGLLEKASALPLKQTFCERLKYFCYVPKADILPSGCSW